SSSSAAFTFGAVNVKKINSFCSSSFKYCIITESAKASLRAFFHEQIGQNRFLHELPLCCFFFSIVCYLTFIIYVLLFFIFYKFVIDIFIIILFDYFLLLLLYLFFFVYN